MTMYFIDIDEMNETARHVSDTLARSVYCAFLLGDPYKFSTSLTDIQDTLDNMQIKELLFKKSSAFFMLEEHDFESKKTALLQAFEARSNKDRLSETIKNFEPWLSQHAQKLYELKEALRVEIKTISHRARGGSKADKQHAKNLKDQAEGYAEAEAEDIKLDFVQDDVYFFVQNAWDTLLVDTLNIMTNEKSLDEIFVAESYAPMLSVKQAKKFYADKANLFIEPDLRLQNKRL